MSKIVDMELLNDAVKKDEFLREFLCDMDLRQEAIDKAREKHISSSVRQLFCMPQTYMILADKMIHGEYAIAPPTIVFVDKKSGNKISYNEALNRNMEGVRQVYMNTEIDRIVLSIIYRIYYRRYHHLIDEHCVSYKKGLSTAKIGKRLGKQLVELQNQGVCYGYKVDLSKFFDSVKIEVINALLKELGTGSVLDAVLYAYYNDNTVIIEGNEVERFKSLAQGCAFGCLLADLVLRKIDAYLASMDVVYYRYSDDILILGRDADKAFRALKKELFKLGLALNPKKVERIDGTRWFEFLGFAFKGDSISLGSKTIANMEREIKERTIGKARQLHRKATKCEIRRYIRSVQKYLFTACVGGPKRFGMGTYIFGAVNNMQDLRVLDEYIKDCLRACATNYNKGLYGIGYNSVDYKTGGASSHVISGGKSRVVFPNTAMTQGPDFVGGDLLIECGYVSLMHMYKAFHTGKNLYEAECLKMASHVRPFAS